MFLKVGVVIHFYVNQSDIATILCENRSNPSMRCNGKCYLKKQLKKAEEAEGNKQLPNTLKEFSGLQPFISDNLNSKPSANCLQIEYLQAEFKLCPSNTTDVFHPPGRLA